MTNKAATEKKFVTLKETKHTTTFQKLADEAMRELDTVKRWKKIHALLRKTNAKARKEQDTTSKDCQFFREQKLINTTKTQQMGLRWGVAVPPMTWNAMIQADLVINGRSDLQHPDKEAGTDLKGTNDIVKNLEKAFPQYKVAK